MTNNIFTVMNMFFPYKDYNSFLCDKLTMFKLCNYGIMSAKVRRVVLFQLILLFMRLILLLMNFCITIRSVYAYFIVYALFSCL
jgi:hypothetical protein